MGGWLAAGAAAPLSFGEERIAVRQCHGQLRAPRAGTAKGPTMLAHLVAVLAYVGLFWPILRAMWAQLGLCWPSLGLCWLILKAMWADLEAYVGRSWGLCWPMLTHVEPKDPKNGNSRKNTVKHRIYWWLAAYLVAMLAHLGAMLAYFESNVGPSWGYVGPSWGYVGPSWGYVGPSWGLCCPILRLCWPILRPMLAHVDPSWATCSEKWEKMTGSSPEGGRKVLLARAPPAVGWGRRISTINHLG